MFDIEKLPNYPKVAKIAKLLKKKQAGKINHKQEFHEDTENKNFKFHKYGKGSLDFNYLPLLECQKCL